MIIMNSNVLLEHLTELEEKIKRMEGLMREMNIDWDRENLMELLIACQVAKTGRQDKNA